MSSPVNSGSSPYEALLINMQGKLKDRTITVQDIAEIGELPFTNQIMVAAALDSDFKEVEGAEKAAWDQRLESIFPHHKAASVPDMVKEGIEEAFLAPDEDKLVSLLQASQIFDEEYLTRSIQVFGKEYSWKACDQLLLNALKSGKRDSVIKTLTDPKMRHRINDKLAKTLFEQLYKENKLDLILQVLNGSDNYLRAEHCPSLLADIKKDQFDLKGNEPLISRFVSQLWGFLMCKRLLAQDKEGLVSLLGQGTSPPPEAERPLVAEYLLSELDLNSTGPDENGEPVSLRSLIDNEEIGPRIMGHAIYQSRETVGYKKLDKILKSKVEENRRKIDADLLLFREAAKDKKFDQLENWPALQAKRQALSTSLSKKTDLDLWLEADEYLQNSKIVLSSKQLAEAMCVINGKMGADRGFRRADVFGATLDKHYPNPRILYTMALPDLFDWIDENRDKENPIIFAAQFFQRFISYHPFSDGNGRTGRMIMDYILMKSGLPPPILTEEENMAAHFPDDPERKPLELSVSEGIRRSLETLQLLPI